MNTRKQHYKATFPRVRFNSNSICKVVEEGHSYFTEYRLVSFLKQYHNGSIKAFIESLLSNMRRHNAPYATNPEYTHLLSLLPAAAESPVPVQ